MKAIAAEAGEAPAAKKNCAELAGKLRTEMSHTQMPSSYNLNVQPTMHSDWATQMGFDLALLDHAHDTPDTIWLRTYTWSAPTLSLGYFQTWKELPELLKSPWKNVAVVRRPTGGGAIWHDGDLTYAIVVPSKHAWAGSARMLYQAIHDAISGLMAADGANLQRRQVEAGGVESGQASGAVANSPFLCFDDGDADDLVVRGVKVVGGAQRRRGWATLQHGSIHWERSSHASASHLPGLLDLCPDFAERSPVKWADRLGKRLSEAWELPYKLVQPPAEVVMSAHARSNRLKELEWLEKR
jgi:lipoate-protein ligase A